MPHHYYCTKCGRELSQKDVLFDMSLLLTQDSKKSLNLLRFRLTERELLNLFNSGRPMSDGYHYCTIDFPTLMAWISNENNLGFNENGIRRPDPTIASLTIADIDEYQRQYEENNRAVQSSSSPSGFGSLNSFLSLDIDAPAEKQEETSTQNTEAQTEYSPIVKHFLGKHVAKEHREYGESRLNDDFSRLRALFRNDQTVSFRLKLGAQPSDNGDNDLVYYGYQLILSGDTVLLCTNARCCPHCDTPVFEQAGTAKHQCVVVIGAQGSGKTSVIDAVTHYLQNAAKGAIDKTIWGRAETLAGLKEVELLSPPENLKQDLRNFAKGIAPIKTPEDLHNPYYATFSIVANNGERHILTLTDLPGELFDIEDGSVDMPRIANQFRVAMACDALMLCFDTTDGSAQQFEGIGPELKVKSACKWAQEFQRYRSNETQDYVPMIVLFTKCADLENPDNNATMKTDGKHGNPISRVHLFHDEQYITDTSPIYKFTMDKFRDNDKLKYSYFSTLRASPFGYRAPSAREADTNPHTLRQTPTPLHIDKLAKWLLYVTGCVEIDMQADLVESTIYLHHCVKPVQHRVTAPTSKDEALSRCILFSNPGMWDQEMALNYLSNAGLRVVQVKMWIDKLRNKNSNTKQT